MKKYSSSMWLIGGLNPGVEVIDQRLLPFDIKTFTLRTVEDAFFAIREMVVRGAPLIGVTAAYGMWLSLLNYKGSDPITRLKESEQLLNSARPTAINLSWATKKMVGVFQPEKKLQENIDLLFDAAECIRSREVESCRRIGEHGLPVIEAIAGRKKGRPIQILTHCNAGWLACVEWGTALAPVYMAQRKGIPLHVWVDETRPRNQGARLTTFELGQAGIPHTVITDNAGGYLMQQDMIDMVIVGSDRTALNGDVANKIGTYLKALAAWDNKIPFYVALPSSSIDWDLVEGIFSIPVEERDQDEVASIEGWTGDKLCSVRLIPEEGRAANYGFDITPARLITALITERGICNADKNSILNLFSDKRTDG